MVPGLYFVPMSISFIVAGFSLLVRHSCLFTIRKRRRRRLCVVVSCIFLPLSLSVIAWCCQFSSGIVYLYIFRKMYDLHQD